MLLFTTTAVLKNLAIFTVKQLCQSLFITSCTMRYTILLKKRLQYRTFPVNCAKFGSSRSEMFCKKGVLKNFANFTGKHLCQSLFLKKVAGL